MTYVSRLKECPRHTYDGLGSARSTMTSALVCSRVFMESSSILILYDFSGHKPDLEGEVQICFRYGFSRPASVYKQ